MMNHKCLFTPEFEHRWVVDLWASFSHSLAIHVLCQFGPARPEHHTMPNQMPELECQNQIRCHMSDNISAYMLYGNSMPNEMPGQISEYCVRNICKINARKNVRVKHTQAECQLKCHRECPNTCKNVCQIKLQNICHIDFLRMSEHMSEIKLDGIECQNVCQIMSNRIYVCWWG